MMTAADIKEEEVETFEEIKVLIGDEDRSDSNQISNVKFTKKRITNHECDQCDHLAKNPRHLKMHKDAYHKGAIFMCDQCDYSSRHKSNLYNHQKAKHEMRVFKCLSCDVTTSFKQYLQKHMKEKHGGQIVYFCSDCDYSSEDKQEYIIHKRTDHYPARKIKKNISLNANSDIPPSSNEDSLSDLLQSSKKVSKTEVYVVEPKLESTLKQFQCKSCDYSTERKHNLTLHNKAVHESTMDFYCEACPFSTTTKGYLQRHLQLMHKDISPKRSYPLFTPVTELPEHRFFNTFGYRLPRLYIDGFILKMNKFFLNDKDEKCAYFYCGNKDKLKCKVSAKAFVDNRDIMEPHVIIDDKEEVSEETADPLTEVIVKTEHSDQEENENGIGMSLMSYLGIHTDMCSKVSPEELLSKRIKKHDLKCDLCEYESTSGSGLEKHREVKHEKVTYACDQCEFNVKYKSSLRRHVQAIHEGKAYHCSLCDHKATTASHLRTHVEGQHEGITYDCDICGKKFKQKGHLKIHYDTMHKGVTHSCPHCSYISRQKGHLTHHIKTIHLGQPHKCDICGTIYAHNGQLKVHKLREHADESLLPKFMCDKCNFFTKEEIFLTRHIQRKHEINEVKKRKYKRPRKKNMKKSTKNSESHSSPIEENVFVELSETKPIIAVTEEEEELSLDENFMAETKFSAEMNK